MRARLGKLQEVEGGKGELAGGSGMDSERERRGGEVDE